MPVFKVWNYACHITCLVLFTWYCDAKEIKPANVDASITDCETLHYLDIDNRSISQSIDPELIEPQSYKFLKIEVSKVFNPKKHPVIFEVHYQIKNHEKIFLGTFSLYPSDNPGKFIVATQGKLKNEGVIILSLVIPEEIEKDDTIRVTVKKIAFTKD